MFQIMEYFIPNEKMGPQPIPQPTILNHLPIIGYECLSPEEITLIPNTVNFIDTGFIINCPNAHILKLEEVSNLIPFKLLNKYIFPNQNQTNKLIIPIITNHFTTLRKNTLLCFLRFISITDVVSLKHHGKKNVQEKKYIHTYIISLKNVSSFPRKISKSS